MNIEEFQVRQDNLRDTRIASVAAAPLADGEVRVCIGKFALTANNISYAISGGALGYWKFFPAADGWGKVPVWGFAEVIESRCEALPVGERIWGFLPMASHLTLRPGKLSPTAFIDFAAHRKALPSLYNHYYRTAADPEPLCSMEDERCLLFPLFSTSYILYDYLLDNDYFGAEQLVVTSASSKTGLGLGQLLHDASGFSGRVIGLTSAANRAFVEALGSFDAVLAYTELGQLDARPAALIDMAGASDIVRQVHLHLGDNVRESCLVGATHWESERVDGPLPGAKPRFFFAPERFAKRDRDWGSGVVLMKAFAASAQLAARLKDQQLLDIVHLHGASAVAENYLALVDNQVPPSRGLMLSLR